MLWLMTAAFWDRTQVEQGKQQVMAETHGPHGSTERTYLDPPAGRLGHDIECLLGRKGIVVTGKYKNSRLEEHP